MKQLGKIIILTVGVACVTMAIPSLANADVGSVSVSAVQSAVRDAHDSVQRIQIEVQHRQQAATIR